MTDAIPPTIRLYRSNRAEVLADVLADLCGVAGADPFDREWLVVQGRGMAVWIAQQVARRQGVWAGSEVLYPRNFVTRALEVVLGEDGKGGGALSREALLWPLMTLLGGSSSDPELARLTRYLEGASPQLRRYQLAARIADVFDQYLTYRPDMLLAWERGEDGIAAVHGEGWQPRLWRKLVERLGDRHLASLERRLQEVLAAPEPWLAGPLPSRIVVVGLASMPPLYVRVLAALSRVAEVHWLLPSPASGYWADLASPARIERALAQGGSLAELHLDQGNPLLASLGKLGADLLEVMESELEALGVAQQEPSIELFREPPSATRLGRLQADILHLRQGDRRGMFADPSITIHACHGPMREVEVLHDQLLALLASGGDLLPHEVVVMMPDVDTYAPLVEAVFERDRKDERFIPHCIADRSLQRESPVTEALLRVMALAGGRITASQVLDLLAVEPLRRRFGIGSSDLDTVSRWVVDGQIRWGVDGRHRARHGQPAVEQNTWREGLARLLLGYAMPAGGQALFAGTLPYDEVEGQEAQLLGRFATFCETLFGILERLEQPRGLGGWRDELVALLSALLVEDADSAWEHDRVRVLLADLCAAAAEGPEEELGIEVVRAAISGRLDGLERAQGFLRAGVTFCAVLPMRSVPFRVVCLLGMSDGVFPRPRHKSEIDLMSRRGEARPGDRNRRDDDRYAFLEAVLAARERLIITYTGQSIRDNSSRDPSVVVSELIDYLVRCEGIEGTDGRVLSEWPASDPLVTRHPLQPFSPRYFDGRDSRLFSFSSVDCAGAVSLTQPVRGSAPPFLTRPLPAPSDEAAAVLALDDLVSFFDHPARYLLRRRLGIDLGDREEDVPDREPVTLSGLERYRIGDQLLTLDLTGLDGHSAAELVRAAGHLPLGSPGRCAVEDIASIAKPLAQRLQLLRQGSGEPLTVNGNLADGTRLGGQIDQVWAGGPVVGQFARVSGRHLLALWIRHLAYCWELGRRGASSGGESFLVGRGPSDDDGVAQLRLRPVKQPERLLADLVELHRIGQREPLRLVPKVAFSYARTVRQRGDEHQSQALDSAWRELAEEHASDPHLRRAFVGPQGLQGEDGGSGAAPSFAVLARRVFDPLLDHLDEGG